MYTTDETRYAPYLFGLFREDVAAGFAASLELSYHAMQYGETLYGLSVEEQQQRLAEAQALLSYLGIQGAFGSVQQYNAAGSAIRYPGATNAAPGYESAPSDFNPFNLPSNSQVNIDAGSVSVPLKAYDVANSVLSKNGAPPQGYKGGRTFANDGREGGQILPNGNYKEYDVNPYVKGQDRGSERIVIGDDASVWYTNDHYDTFTRIK